MPHNSLLGTFYQYTIALRVCKGKGLSVPVAGRCLNSEVLSLPPNCLEKNRSVRYHEKRFLLGREGAREQWEGETGMKGFYWVLLIVAVCFCVAGLMGHPAAWGAAALCFFAAVMVIVGQQKKHGDGK